MSKAIDKFKSASEAFTSIIATEQNALEGFLRTSLLTLVTATGAFLTATEGVVMNEKTGKPASREFLFNSIVAATGERVSLATLRRWATVADEHKRLGVKASEGSASAVYALTESGMTDARNAFKALSPESVKDADAIVSAVVEATNIHPKVESKSKAQPVTAADVENAPFSREAFAESVRALLDKVPEGERSAAIKTLRAIATDASKALVNA